MGRPRRESEAARPSRNYVQHSFYDKGGVMSAPAIRAWNSVTRQQIEDALTRLHPDDRPSFDATVSVGAAVAVLTNATRGYCDATTQQIYDHLKGAYSVFVIRNALWALQVAGIVANVKRGTIGKDGKGRGAHRVFVNADTHDLIPADFTPPLPRRDSSTGHDLSQTCKDSHTGMHNFPTGNDESHTGHDLSTPKESISSSTPALAGRGTTEDSLGPVDAQDSEMPPPCETCTGAQRDVDAIDRLVLAVMADETVTRNTSAARRIAMKKDAATLAQILRAHYPSLPNTSHVHALSLAMRERKVIGPARHDYVLGIAANRLTDFL